MAAGAGAGGRVDGDLRGAWHHQVTVTGEGGGGVSSGDTENVQWAGVGSGGCWV